MTQTHMSQVKEKVPRMEAEADSSRFTCAPVCEGSDSRCGEWRDSPKTSRISQKPCPALLSRKSMCFPEQEEPVRLRPVVMQGFVSPPPSASGWCLNALGRVCGVGVTTTSARPCQVIAPRELQAQRVACHSCCSGRPRDPGTKDGTPGQT